MLPRHRLENGLLPVHPPPDLRRPENETRGSHDERLYRGSSPPRLDGMRNEALCGVCNLWLRGGLSNHNKGKRHLALYAAILERIAAMPNNYDRGQLSAPTIVDGSQRDEQSKQ